MDELTVNSVYTIELCSGEIRQWQYLGPDSRRQVWWMDVETGQEFNEASLMYAWSVTGRSEAPRKAGGGAAPPCVSPWPARGLRG